MTPPDETETEAMAIALACSHGRWLGEAQFGACVPCIAVALRVRTTERVRAAGPIVQAAQRWGELQTARGLEAMSYPHTAKIIEAEKALIGLLALQAGARGREP